MTVFEINGHFVRMAWRRKNNEHVAGLYVPIEYRGYGKGKNMMIGVDCLLGSQVTIDYRVILGSENSLRSVKLYHFPPESLLPSHQGASFIPTRKLLPFPREYSCQTGSFLHSHQESQTPSIGDLQTNYFSKILDFSKISRYIKKILGINYRNW